MPRKITMRCVRIGWVLLSSLACLHAGAQSSAPGTAPAPSERVQRDADKVFKMILLHRDKKSPVKAPAKDAAAAAKPVVAPVTSRDAPIAPIATAAVSSSPRSLVTDAAATPPPNSAAQAEPTSSPALVPAGSTVAADSPPAVAVSTAPDPKPETPLPAAPALAPVEAALPISAVPITTVLALPAQPPRLELVSAVEPDFPSRLVRTLGTGGVVVNFAVAADGRVAHANAVSSSHRGLEPAAIAAVLQWRFKAMSGPANGTTELKFE